MENFDFYSPTYFAFGHGREREAGKYARQFGARKVLLHYGGGSVVRSGLLDRVKESLLAASLPFVELGGVQPNPRSELVYEGIRLARGENVDFILAVGGGSVIDSAKAIALGALADGDFWDFYTGAREIGGALPLGAVLTIAAAGSEGSGNSVITRDGLKRSTGSDALRPKFSIMNPELTATLSPYQVACGGADIMAHVFERYFTNTKGVETTDRLCEGLLLSLVSELPKAVANPADYDAQANIMWAGMLAHNNAVGVGRAQDWASHSIEHEMSAMYGIAHGAGLAVVFPAWMKYVLGHDAARFVRLAGTVFGISGDGRDPADVALEGVDALKAFWRSLGLPTTFAELGGREEDIPRLAANVMLGNRRAAGGAIGGFTRLSVADVEKIYALMK
ncbi:MAG: iron-containing alcohol dehydrogenase [Rickettsiales bacterium]|jgi:alcohol dehydrogenase YqhD (iron-dependent ADH family)|nr:iron-containing alcohol dehydrogenase [Rickettsiales bacterium]